MATFHFVLLILALLCFGSAGLGLQAPRSFNLLALGLMFWVLAIILTTAH